MRKKKTSLMDPVSQKDLHQKYDSASSKVDGRNLEEKVLLSLKIDTLCQLPELASILASSVQSATQLPNQPVLDILNLELPRSTSEPLVQLPSKPLEPLVESPLESSVLLLSDTQDELIPIDSKKNGNDRILKKENTVGHRIKLVKYPVLQKNICQNFKASGMKPKIEEHCRSSSNLEKKSLSLNIETSIPPSKKASNLTSFVKSPTHLKIQDELNESKGNRKRKSGKHGLPLKRKKIVSSSIESPLEPELDKDIQVTSKEPILAPVYNTEHRIELPIDSLPVQPPIQSPMEPPIHSALEPPIQPPLEPTIQPTIKTVGKLVPSIKISFSNGKMLGNGREISFNKYSLHELDPNKYVNRRRWNASLATFIEPEIDSNYYIFKNALSRCFYTPKINNVYGATLYKYPTKSDKSVKFENTANMLNSSLSNLTSANLPDEVKEEPESDERELDKQSLKHQSISCQISEKSEKCSNSINESPLKENELHLLDREHVVTNVKIPILDNTHSKTNNLGIIPTFSINFHYPNSYSTKLNYQPKDNNLIQDRIAKFGFIPISEDEQSVSSNDNNKREERSCFENDGNSDVLSHYVSTLNDELDTCVPELNVNLEPPKEYLKSTIELWCESVENLIEPSDINFETDFDLKNRKCYWAAKSIRRICKSFGDCENKCGRKHFIDYQFYKDILSFEKEDLDIFYEYFVANININVIKVLFPLVVNRYSELKVDKKLILIIEDVLKFNTNKSHLIKMIIDGLKKCDSIEYDFENAVIAILMRYGIRNTVLTDILLDLITKESDFLRSHFELIRIVAEYRSRPKINPTITEHIIEEMLKSYDFGFVKGDYEKFYKDFLNKECVNLKAIKKSLFTKLVKKMEENNLLECSFCLRRDYNTNENDQDLDAEVDNFMEKSNKGGLVVPPVDDFDIKDLKSLQISLNGDAKLFENLLLKYRGEIVKEFFIAQLIVFLKGPKRMNKFTDMFLRLLDKYKYGFVEDKVLENMFISIGFNALPCYDLLKDYTGATRIILSFYNYLDSFLRSKCLWTIEPYCRSLRNEEEKLVYIVKFLNKTYELEKSVKLIMHEKFNLVDDKNPTLFNYKTSKIHECIRKCFETRHLRLLKILIYHLIHYDSIQKEINMKLYYNQYLLRVINGGLDITELKEQYINEISKHFDLLDSNILRGLLVVLFQNNMSIHMIYKGFEICDEKYNLNQENVAGNYLYLNSKLTNTEIKINIYMFILKMVNRIQAPSDIEIQFLRSKGSTNTILMPKVLLESLKYRDRLEEVKSRVKTVVREMNLLYLVTPFSIIVLSQSVETIMEELRRTKPVFF